MKKFISFLNEDVTPAALVKNGAIDIDNPLVREQINSSLASVTADPAVTPYNVLIRISKVLAYFHVILPKRVYLEGEKDVEAIELRQFGERMGMNDQGEFVREVPEKFYLFIQYGRTSVPHSTYAMPTVGGMFKVFAKVVNKDELDRLIDIAQMALAEEHDAECQQRYAKMGAPTEPMHDVTSKESDTADRAFKKSWKRREGIAKAVARLTKEETLDEKAPPGREEQVKALKKKFPKGSGSPFAIAWSSYNKSHQKEETKFDPSTEIPRNN